MTGERDKDAGARLTQLMERYGDDVLRLCWLLAGERAAAEDAAQEAFLKAFRHLDSLRDARYEKTWLMRIAVNTCRDMRRSAWRRHMDRRMTPEDLPEAAEAFDERDDTVVREVMSLPPRCREAVLMRYYQGLSPRECAEALGVSRSSFYRRLQKAQNVLRVKLEGWVFDEENDEDLH